MSRAVAGLLVAACPLLVGAVTMTAEDVTVRLHAGEPALVVLTGRADAPCSFGHFVVKEPVSGNLTGVGKYRRYTPAEGFDGDDSFTYVIAGCGGRASESATVRVKVLASRKCASTGPTDGLVVHVPIDTGALDVTGSDVRVAKKKSQRQASTPVNYFGWQSRSNLTAAQITIKPAAPVTKHYSISLKFKPTDLESDQVILRAGSLEISLVSGAVRVRVSCVRGWGRWRYHFLRRVAVASHPGLVKVGGCNHVAVTVTEGGAVQVWLNGVAGDSKGLPGPHVLGPIWFLGPYNGNVWDFRAYNRAIGAAEVGELSVKCRDVVAPPAGQESYDNGLCGVFVCIHWKNESTVELPIEKYEYYLKMQDVIFERYVLEAGMYPHKDLCGFLAATDRALLLSEGIQKAFVRPHSEDQPVNQNWVHEAFHRFQSQLRRNGGGRGTKDLIESSSSWAADYHLAGTPEGKDSLLGMYTLVPHLPLWTTQGSRVNESIVSRFQGGHQYGAFIFLAYVTRYIASPAVIGDMFNHALMSSRPFEGLSQILATLGHDMREVFADFAARTINFDYGADEVREAYKESEQASQARMFGRDADPTFPGWKIASEHSEEGTGGVWTPVPDNLRPGGWAYNAFKVSGVNTTSQYDVRVRQASFNPPSAEFRARVVVKKELPNAFVYTPLPVATAAGSVVSTTVAVEPGDVLFLVVSSTPSVFSGFASYQYEYQIEPSAQSTV